METSPPISRTALFKAHQDLQKPRLASIQESDEDKLATLSDDNRWKLLVDRIKLRIEALKELSDLKPEEMDNVELVGFKFLASRVAIANLLSVIQDVELPAQVKRDRQRIERGNDVPQSGESEADGQ